jgi:hypothetical protein
MDDRTHEATGGSNHWEEETTAIEDEPISELVGRTLAIARDRAWNESLL